jgi:hypothetical protein
MALCARWQALLPTIIDTAAALEFCRAIKGFPCEIFAENDEGNPGELILSHAKQSGIGRSSLGIRAAIDQVAPRSPPPEPSAIKGEGFCQHYYLYSRALDGGGLGWG